MKNLLTPFVLTSTVLLSGCTYSTQFDCPIGEGNACASISQNVQKIDDGFYEEKPAAPLDKKIFFREDF